jgi:hypothetical protein
MKKVAATSGQSVSLAVRLVWGIARAGNWAGRDTVLNLLSRPPHSDPRALSGVFGASSQSAEYGYSLAMQEKSALGCKYFPKRFQFVTPTDKREGVFSDNIQMILIKTKIHEDDLRSERGLPAIE